MWLNNHFSQKPVTGRHRCNWKSSFQIITELWVKRRPISVQICIMCVACNGTKRSSLFLEQKKVTGVTKSTKSANNSVSCFHCSFYWSLFERLSAISWILCVLFLPSLSSSMPSFAAVTFLNMDTSSGSPTLDGPLTSTLSYGSSSNNTGYFFLVLFKYLNEECSFFFLRVGFIIVSMLSLTSLYTYWQAGSGQSVWTEEMADWWSCIQNWTALLPLLVSDRAS